MKKITVQSVNAALRKLGHPEKLRRGNCYYYFEGGNSCGWYSTSVCVNRVDQLSIEQWIAKRNDLAGV